MHIDSSKLTCEPQIVYHQFPHLCSSLQATGSAKDCQQNADQRKKCLKEPNQQEKKQWVQQLS